MSRKRRYSSAQSRNRRYDQSYWYDAYPRRRGCFAALRHLILRAVIILLWGVGTIIFIFLLLLIVFHFALFLLVLSYLVYVAAGLAALSFLYVVIRIVTAISHRLSSASVARSKARIAREQARIERQRVEQAHNEVRTQQSKLAREEYLFYQKHDPSSSEYAAPSRRTRVLSQEEPALDPSCFSAQRASRGDVGVRSYQSRVTRVLSQEGSAFLERVPPSQPSQSHTGTSNLVPEEQIGKAAARTPPPIPHIGHLLGNLVQAGQSEMLHGFRVVNGTVEAIQGELPATAIIAGKSGSGKTRRIILMVFQALLIFHALGKGYKITVCDPHSAKPDGLLQVLAPFIPWLHVARTNSEIITAAREHLEEMESRLAPGGSRNGEGLMPRLVIFDEFPRLMKSQEISRAEKRILADAVRKSAVEYRGIFGYAWIIGQEWTQDAIFDTALRKDAQAILCHQLSAEYAAFLFPLETKTQRLIQQIERRECVFKDADNHVLRIVTPTITDEEIPTLVNYLARYVPHQAQQPSIHSESIYHQDRLADGSPNDTVLIPEPEPAPASIPVSQVAPKEGQPDRFALLAQLQRQKKEHRRPL